MRSLFFLLSGENPTLPASELEALLQAEGYSYRNLRRSGQLVRVDAAHECVPAVVVRSAYVKEGCLELAKAEGDWKQLIKEIEKTSFDGSLPPGSTIAVRATGTGEVRIDVPRAEREVGASLLNNVGDLRVRLDNPSHRLRVVCGEGFSLIGLVLGQRRGKEFYGRRASRRPFFLPTALQPKFARCMVNMARVSRGDSLLDPFTGTGSLLVEAGLIGCRAVGLELKHWICRGALKNLGHYLTDYDSPIVADARRAPLRFGWDAIVTDPPYGRSSTTLGLSPERLLEEFLPEAYGCLRLGGYVCMTVPHEMGLEEVAAGFGYQLVERHTIFIHDRLTRKLLVLRKR